MIILEVRREILTCEIVEKFYQKNLSLSSELEISLRRDSGRLLEENTRCMSEELQIWFSKARKDIVDSGEQRIGTGSCSPGAEY